QQAAEKVAKSLGLKLGVTLWGHSVTEILKILSEKVDIPDGLKDKARILDLYYIPARYPNGFPSGKPADYFTELQAREAIDASDHIVRFCESHLN
ncbi:MAG TPA: HEPN domain-containing protein, partial [Thermodesulfobacteriota bacterium]|nr:HEPN domain-containing protein [Thermodesulfobacteriota bacterium]